MVFLFQNNTTLKTLILEGNLIGNVGALAIARGIANHVVNLTKLDLSMNKVSDYGGISLKEGLSK